MVRWRAFLINWRKGEPPIGMQRAHQEGPWIFDENGQLVGDTNKQADFDARYAIMKLLESGELIRRPMTETECATLMYEFRRLWSAAGNEPDRRYWRQKKVEAIIAERERLRTSGVSAYDADTQLARRWRFPSSDALSRFLRRYR